MTHVALESTGVYWKPVYYVLEDAFTLLLINMQVIEDIRKPLSPWVTRCSRSRTA